MINKFEYNLQIFIYNKLIKLLYILLMDEKFISKYKKRKN